MSKVIIVNGSGGVGKDTFCMLCGKYFPISICSSVSEIKKAAMILGWDGTKDDRSRRFLSDLKDLATAYSDAPMRHMRDYVNEHQQSNELIFLMIREPEEIARAKKEFNATTLLLCRPSIGDIYTNHADRNVSNFNYDYTIFNTGTLEELSRKAQEFVQNICC